MDEEQDRLNQFLELSEAGRPTTIELAKGMTEGKERTEITLRQVTEQPTHVFWDIGGFAKYLTTYGSPNMVVLGDPATGQIRAVLDDMAGKGFEIVTFEAKIDPRWKVWSEVLGKTLAVKDFGKFIVTQKPLISEPDGELLAQIFAQIRTSKKVELQAGFGAESTNGVMVEVEIRGQTPQKQPVKLPTFLKIEVPLFIGRPAATVQIDIVLDVKNEQVVVELYSGEAEVQRMVEITKMLAEVQETLKDRFVSFGQVGHRDWKYINTK